MRNAHWFLITILLLALAFQAMAAPAAKPAPLSVLVLSGQNNHDWKTTTPALAKMLEQAGFRVTVTEHPEQLTLAGLRSYRAVLSDYNGKRWGQVAEQALLQYVREGGGFVVIHAANNAFADWPEYDRLIGGAWRAGAGHGERHPYLVRVVNFRHPITRGMPDFLGAEDELYHRMTMQPEAVVLATAYSSKEKGGTGRDEPMAWVVYYGKGRMFQTDLGHDTTAMSSAGFIALVQRGTEWAATGVVKQRMPAAALAASALSAEDEEVRYAAKTRLIKLGGGAIPVLFDCLGRDEVAADEAYSSLRWIAMRAFGTSAAPGVVAALAAQAAPGHPAERRALALRVLGLVAAPEDAGLLLRYLGEAEVGEAALDGLAALPGPAVTAAIARTFSGAGPEQRARVLDLLGSRSDPSALKAVLAGAADGDQSVRLAALRALGKLGDSGALPVLRSAVTSAAPAIHAAAFDSLLRLAESRRAGQPAEAQAIYREALGAAASPAERAAALVGLGAVGDARVVPLVAPLVANSDDTVAITAVNTLSAAAPKDAASLAALRQAAGDARAVVAGAALAALARSQDREAVGAIVAATKSPDQAVQAAALRALGAVCATGSLPDREVVAAIMGQLESPEPVRAAAVDAALAIAGKLPPGQQPALGDTYTRLLAAAVTDQQRQGALEGLALSAPPASLPGIQAALASGHAGVREAAVTAEIAVAGALAQAGSKQEAISAYQQALSLVPADSRLGKVVEALNALGVQVDAASARGFITHWWVLGPFPNGGNAAFNTAYPPEQGVDLGAGVSVGDRELTWSKQHVTDSSGILDLAAVIKPPDNSAAYCYAEVTSPAEQQVLFKLGSDDGAVLWVNGTRLFGTPEMRGLTVDSDIVPGKLAAGVNHILVKALNGSSDYQLCLRLTDPSGRPLQLEQKAQ